MNKETTQTNYIHNLVWSFCSEQTQRVRFCLKFKEPKEELVIGDLKRRLFSVVYSYVGNKNFTTCHNFLKVLEWPCNFLSSTGDTYTPQASIGYHLFAVIKTKIIIIYIIVTINQWSLHEEISLQPPSFSSSLPQVRAYAWAIYLFIYKYIYIYKKWQVAIATLHGWTCFCSPTRSYRDGVVRWGVWWLLPSEWKV